MLHANVPFHAKSGNQAELPEDHCGEQEAPEQDLLSEEEVKETYEN
ncbi:MAG TPA: hypothetical protein VH024_10520 [Candidatus Angelobacter sp.]|jgi:hypothetical protein|nr:hypothetical protein [Candidatus Angelobacter sp.]